MAGNEVAEGPACSTDGSCCGPDSPCCHEYAGPVEFRRATAHDLANIETLLSQSNLPLEGVSGCIEKFFVAEAGGAIVGSIGMETYERIGLLRSAAVSKPLQGRGIGRHLVERLLADAEQQGITTMYLLTMTAEGYFPSFGFEKVDRSTVPPALQASAELQDACPASAIVMKKELRAS
jgi:amino-acid N-acetyltransferase